MRSLLYLILGLVLLTQSACAQPAPPAGVNVMTFNIRYNNPGDGVHAWPLRKDRVASTIRFYEADLVGVQEALVGQLADLDGLLPGFSRLGVGRDDGAEAGEFSAILYRTDRFTPLDQGTFWLSPTPDVVGSVGWDAAITRVVTWAEFEDRQTGATFFHFNTHFDHRGEQAREESARLLVQQIDALAGGRPAVVTGDFNFTPAAPGYSVLTARLTDAMTRASGGHHGPEATIYGFEVTGEPGRRIDYIFTTPDVAVARHATLSDNWDGAFASDHLAVFAEIVVTP